MPPNRIRARDQWLGVELRHLAALAAVAREGSFRAAAEELGYVQSAVSQQIAALERLVGTRLVNRSRGPRPVELTDAGRLLLEHSEEILARLQAAQTDLSRITNGQQAVVRVGVFQSVAIQLIPRIIPVFDRLWPDVQVIPTETSNDAPLFDLIESGQLDIAFADLPLEPGRFVHSELLEDPYVLLVQAGSPLASSAEPPTLAEIASLPLIGHVTCRAQPGVEAQLRAHGLAPSFAFRSDVNATVQGLVARGVGAAIVPRLCAEPDDPCTSVVGLGSMLRPRILALFWHRDRRLPEWAQGFRDTVLTCCADGRAGGLLANRSRAS